MITYIGTKDAPIPFEGPSLNNIAATPEETQAIVRKDNGAFAVASFCYRRFDDGAHWVIWTDEEYSTQFKALLTMGLVFKLGRGWVFDECVRRAQGAA